MQFFSSISNCYWATAKCRLPQISYVSCLMGRIISYALCFISFFLSKTQLVLLSWFCFPRFHLCIFNSLPKLFNWIWSLRPIQFFSNSDRSEIAFEKFVDFFFCFFCVGDISKLLRHGKKNNSGSLVLGKLKCWILT